MSPLEALYVCLAAIAVYWAFGWAGLAIFAGSAFLFLLANVIAHLKVISSLLTARLPMRCVVCHREVFENSVRLREEWFHKDCAVATKENLDRTIAEADKRSATAKKPNPPKCRWADVWP